MVDSPYSIRVNILLPHIILYNGIIPPGSFPQLIRDLKKLIGFGVPLLMGELFFEPKVSR